jgi:signal transduction histidine kinase
MTVPAPLPDEPAAGRPAGSQIGHLRRSAQRWRAIFTGVMAAMVLLLWAAFLEHSAHEHDQALHAIAQRDANLATAVEHYVTRILRSARAVHRLLAREAAEGASAPRLQEVLRDRAGANDAFSELALCLQDGRILSSAGARTRLTPQACERLLVRAGNFEEVTVAPPLALPGSLQVPLALPLRRRVDGGATVAVGLVPAPTLLGIMRSAQQRDASIVTLSDELGNLRAAWRSDTGPVADAAGLAVLLPLAHADIARTTLAGTDYLVVNRALPAWGLRIRIATAQADALAAYHARRQLYLAVCASLTLVLVAVYVVLMRLHGQSTAAARSLVHARADLESLNAKLDSEVRDRTAQLEQAYRELETFSYTIAHDVRAPLAAISGFAQALEPTVEAAGEERPRRWLQRIQANAAQMDQLTQHLLELGRLTRTPLRLQDVDLGALVQEVAAGLREREPQRDVELRVQDGLQVQGDHALLRQLVENLLGNAWKFTGRRGTARIRVGRSEGGGAFFVADNGAGFDSARAPALFEPFRRMHTSEEFPGTGVGLAAVQRIVTLHGGRLWCDARPDAGATFYFTLRAGEPAGDA